MERKDLSGLPIRSKDNMGYVFAYAFLHLVIVV